MALSYNELRSLDKSWADKLGGFRIMAQDSPHYGALTAIEGAMPDQAKLAGVLNTLYEHHFTLLAVHYLTDQKSKEHSSKNA